MKRIQAKMPKKVSNKNKMGLLVKLTFHGQVHFSFNLKYFE